MFLDIFLILIFHFEVLLKPNNWIVIHSQLGEFACVLLNDNVTSLGRECIIGASLKNASAKFTFTTKSRGLIWSDRWSVAVHFHLRNIVHGTARRRVLKVVRAFCFASHKQVSVWIPLTRPLITAIVDFSHFPFGRILSFSARPKFCPLSKYWSVPHSIHTNSPPILF